MTSINPKSCTNTPFVFDPSILFLVARMLLVVWPGATFVASSCSICSDALCSERSFLFLLVRPGAPNVACRPCGLDWFCCKVELLLAESHLGKWGSAAFLHVFFRAGCRPIAILGWRPSLVGWRAIGIVSEDNIFGNMDSDSVVSRKNLGSGGRKQRQRRRVSPKKPGTT